jgi:hypothetical protein
MARPKTNAEEPLTLFGEKEAGDANHSGDKSEAQRQKVW